jgi:NAD+ synthase
MADQLLTANAAEAELDRAVDLLRTTIGDGEACVLLSGGLDSDVTARLTSMAVGPSALKLVTVLQDEMSRSHRAHAGRLAKDLNIPLVELDFRGLQLDVVYRLAHADVLEGFDPTGLLDPSRMKCSLRTVVASVYQDRGFTIVGTSNRTELELGFYLPFGDGLWRVGPLAHLYKTEVRLLAELAGTAAKVLSQPPSAGFWRGQTDQEDLGYWLVNEGPIHRERTFSAAESRRAAELADRLDERDIDIVLLAIRCDEDPLANDAGQRLGPEVVAGIRSIVESSARTKNQPLGVRLSRSATSG